MNILNRIIAIILFLFFILVGIIVLLALFGFQLALPGGLLQQELDALSDLTGWQLILVAFLGVIFVFLLALLVALEIPQPRKEQPIVLSSTASGVITVNRRSVERLAEKLGSDMAQVRDINCSAFDHPKGLKIRCEPVLFSGSNLQDSTQEIQQRVKEGVERTLGVPVRELRVRARIDPSGAKRREHEL